MRTKILLPMMSFVVGVAAAQSVPQGPTKTAIATYQEGTNTVVLAVDALAETNQTDSSKLAFLMGTGMQYADEGDYKAAEQSYLRALSINPRDPNIRFRLGTLYIQVGVYRAAEAILSELSAEFPENGVVHNNLAWIYCLDGETKNGKLALRHARDAIIGDPISPSLWNTLAEAHYVCGHYDDALRAAEYAMELLRLQGGGEKQIEEFERQRTKIKRAQEVHKRFIGLDDKEK